MKPYLRWLAKHETELAGVHETQHPLANLNT